MSSVPHSVHRARPSQAFGTDKEPVSLSLYDAETNKNILNDLFCPDRPLDWAKVTITRTHGNDRHVEGFDNGADSFMYFSERTCVHEDQWKLANVTEAEQPLYLPDEDNKPFMQQDGEFKATPHGKFSLWYNKDTQRLRSFCLEPYKQSTLIECGPVDGDSCLSWLRDNFFSGGWPWAGTHRVQVDYRIKGETTVISTGILEPTIGPVSELEQ